MKKNLFFEKKIIIPAQKFIKLQLSEKHLLKHGYGGENG